MTARRRLVAGLGPIGLVFGCSPTPPPAPVAYKASTGSTAPLHPVEPADEATTTSTAAPETTTTTTEPVIVVSGLPPTTEGTTTTKVRPRPLPTTTLPERADDDLDDDEWWATQPGVSGRAAVLACIRSYEQGAAGYATNTGNGFYGAYQFDLPTWRSVGGSGLPSDASPAEQDMRAGMLIDRRGLSPWPTPSRRCG